MTARTLVRMTCRNQTNHLVRERGSIAVLSIMTFALFTLCAVGVVRVGTLIASRGSAQNAADAVALAWVAGAELDARHVATANGVRIVRSSTDMGVRRVWVCAGTVCASASASASGSVPSSTWGPNLAEPHEVGDVNTLTRWRTRRPDNNRHSELQVLTVSPVAFVASRELSASSTRGVSSK